MKRETRQSIEDTGRVCHDVGRALIVSSHMISKPAVVELLQNLGASLHTLARQLQEDDTTDDERIIVP